MPEKRYVIVDRGPVVKDKPYYTEVDEAVNKLLDVRKGRDKPEQIVLVELTVYEDMNVESRDVTVADVKVSNGKPNVVE